VPLPSTVGSNVYIDTAYLDNPFAIGGERNQLTVKLFNDGNEARNQLTVRLSLNGLQAGTATASLPVNGSAEVRFEISAMGLGTQQAVLSFTDNPVAFDNDFFATLQFSERIRVLEIKTFNSVSHIEKVYGNPTVFDFSTVNSNNIDYSKLQYVDLVVLNEVRQLDNSLAQALQQYVKQGGSVMLIPASDPVINSYQSLVPGMVAHKQSEMLALQSPDFNNPLFENIFQERTGQMAMPSVRNTVAWGPDRQAVLQQVDGTPYLSVVASSGTVYILGSPLQSVYSSFFAHALFVPVMYRIAAMSQQNKPALYQLVSQPLVSLEAALPPNAIVTMVGKEELTPAQRIFNEQVMIDLNGLEILPGHYVLKNGSDTVGQLAFNQGKAESKMKTIAQPDLSTLFAGRADVYALGEDASVSMAESIRDAYQGKPLWRYALLFALFFIAAEISLLRFWK
jgi:hypothetical protein